MPAGGPGTATVLRQAVRRELQQVAPEVFAQAWAPR